MPRVRDHFERLKIYIYSRQQSPTLHLAGWGWGLICVCFLGPWLIFGLPVGELAGQPKFSPYAPISPFSSWRSLWPCDIHLSHSTIRMWPQKKKKKNTITNVMECTYKNWWNMCLFHIYIERERERRKHHLYPLKKHRYFFFFKKKEEFWAF